MSINEHDRAAVEQFLIEQLTAAIETFSVGVESDALAAMSSDVLVAAGFNPFTLSKVKKRWNKVVDTVHSVTGKMFKTDEIDLTPVHDVVDDMDVPTHVHARVSRALEQGAADGWSKQKMSDHVQKIIGRPEVLIAGIAVGLATVITSVVIAKALAKNKVKYKKWRSLHDARVRDDHSDADGQVQLADEPFTVGGALLRYPGDPAGPPEQIMNCRCVMIGANRDGEAISIESADMNLNDYLILVPR